MSPLPKHIVAALLLMAAGVGILLYQPAQSYAIVVAIAGAGVILFAGSGAGGAQLGGITDSIRRASSGERPTSPAGATGELARTYEELGALADRRARETADHAKRSRELDDAEHTLEEVTRRLSEGVTMQVTASEETTKLIRGMTSQVHEIAQHVEALTSSAEESSSSILEMTATNDEVAENVG